MVQCLQKIKDTQTTSKKKNRVICHRHGVSEVALRATFWDGESGGVAKRWGWRPQVHPSPWLYPPMLLALWMKARTGFYLVRAAHPAVPL